MPFYRYTAIDSSGRQMAGSIQARDTVEAAGSLQIRGYKAIQFQSKDQDFVRTKRANDRDLMYMFAQLASMTRAGISPASAFEKLAERPPRGFLREILLNISRAAKQGEKVSEQMAKYLDVFPSSCVAMTRAGEYGGFLPEAFQNLADHFAGSASFKRWFWFLKFTTWQSVLTVVLFIPALPSAWQTFQAGGGLSVFIESYSRMLLRSVLPIAGSIALLVIIVMIVLRSHSCIRFRHRFVLRLPWGFGARAREESLRTSLWSLQRLSKAGIAPGTAWALSAATAPNVEYAIRLAESGRALASEKPLSAAMLKSELFPPDYGQLLSTAEFTGDIPNTLEQMLKLTDTDYEVANTRSRAGLSQVGCLIMLVTAGIVVVLFVALYYGQVFEQVEKWAQ